MPERALAAARMHVRMHAHAHRRIQADKITCAENYAHACRHWPMRAYECCTVRELVCKHAHVNFYFSECYHGTSRTRTHTMVDAKIRALIDAHAYTHAHRHESAHELYTHKDTKCESGHAYAEYTHMCTRAIRVLTSAYLRFRHYGMCKKLLVNVVECENTWWFKDLTP